MASDKNGNDKKNRISRREFLKKSRDVILISSSYEIFSLLPVLPSGHDDKKFKNNKKMPDPVLWRFEFEGRKTDASYTTSPVFGSDGTIYVGNTTLYALASNGERKWAYETGSIITQTPCVTPDGNVVFGCFDGTIHSLNPDGSLNWTNAAGSRTILRLAIGKNGSIFLGTDDKKLLCMNSDESKNWAIALDGFPRTSPILDDSDNIYLGISKYDSSEFKAFTSDGQTLWTHAISKYDEMPKAATVTHQGDGVCFVNITGLHFLDQQGNQQWEIEAPVERNQYIEGNGLVQIDTDQTIYASCLDGFLYAVNMDGGLRWKRKIGACKSLILTDRAIYCLGKTCYAISKNGEKIWKLTLGNKLASSFIPTIDSEDIVYFVADEEDLVLSAVDPKVAIMFCSYSCVQGTACTDNCIADCVASCTASSIVDAQTVKNSLEKNSCAKCTLLTSGCSNGCTSKCTMICTARCVGCVQCTRCTSGCEVSCTRCTSSCVVCTSCTVCTMCTMCKACTTCMGSIR